MKFKIFRYRKPELLKERGDLIGFVTERPDDEHITLYSLLLRESKSVVLRRIVADWVANQAQSKDDIINGIVEYCLNVWVVHYRRPNTTNERNKSTLLKDIKYDLVSRGLEETIINTILNDTEKKIVEYEKKAE